MTVLTFSRLERVGRLGNQLWQVAATFGLARRYGYDPRFPTRWSYRPFFNIPDEFFADVRGVESYTLPDLDHIKPEYRVYMQDRSLWVGYEAEIRAMFAPTTKVRLSHAVLHPSLVIHVRRGDNVRQQDHYPLPSLRYYADAAVNYPGLPIVIFGDDHAWNTEVLQPALSGRDVTCVYGTPRPKEHEASYFTAPILDHLDVLNMASAGPESTFVLSNSTLGWWGAVLSGSADVVYPDPWYGPLLPDIDASLMMPPHWERRNARP